MKRKISQLESGDIILVNIDLRKGREQGGERPVVVITPGFMNRLGILGVLPVTSKVKGFPFEIALPANLKTKGVILGIHFRSLDLKERRWRHLETIPEDCYLRVREFLKAVLVDK
jgi:mRNA interferase MazF